MHPDVTSDKPGRCSKCGMRLVQKGDMSMSPNHAMPDAAVTWKSYQPLIVIVSLILVTSAVIAATQGGVMQRQIIMNFMIGFFLVFSGFKLMDLKGFAEGYATYNLLAMRWFPYGYLYPFIELGFGLGMILLGDKPLLLISEIIVMLFSGVGVARKLLKKERFQCACLGTFLKVPLTKVTIIEDFGMALLAFVLLLLS